jgi:hypothetical protein
MDLSRIKFDFGACAMMAVGEKVMTSRPVTFALACFVGAAAWPWIVGALAALVMSPLERAAQSAWCGMPFHSSYEALGHCAACWVGSALLVATGLTFMQNRQATHSHAHQTIRRRIQ